MVSLRFVSHSKEEVAKDAQKRVHGTASGGCTSKVGDHEAGMEAQASCFVVSLKKKQDVADVFIALRQFWSRRVFFGMQALLKNRGTYIDDQNWHSTIPTSLTGTP